ncbi:phage head morphogenesis protein [Pasteurellaceae bacterium USgator11]|nr:phage head morphogenesis protein [Pasteurellaceae bacterium USgator41]TNG98703.1 phage head morphogenesis protein [Pasteurellaceae bacterium UScroc31]TNH00070.1 phage head morphogenesis protein [Pasteurellaceae bacterium USgator11]
MNKFTFKEQARYFEKKLNLKTNSYLDVLGEEHDYYFMVAGANRNEVLLALREAVDVAIHNGETLEQFRNRFDEIEARTGWQYNGGRNWRTRIIYDTNVYGAYNCGRLKQHLELADVMPYWEYQHNDNSHPRPEHMAWDGLVLRYDDPWWKYHYPIKAYGCHCTVVAHDEHDLAMLGKTVGTAPAIEFEEKLVGVRSGNPRMVTVAKGTDVGFVPYDFAKLKQGRDENVDQLLMNKLITAEPKFASLLFDDVMKKTAGIAYLNQAMKSMVDEVQLTKQAKGQIKNVGVIPEKALQKLDELGKAPQTAVIAVRDDDVLHALRDSKVGKGINLPIEFWQQLPENLRKPTAILLETQQKQPTLLFVYQTEQGKVAVKMDYEIKLKDKLSSKKLPHKLNLVRTASLLKDFTALYDFELLWGSLD